MKSELKFKNKNMKDNLNLEEYEKNTNFNQFLIREKMFEHKLSSNKEKMMKTINDEIFSKMQTKPNIDEKSRRIMNDKNKFQKRIKQNNSASRINNKKPLMKLESSNSNRNLKYNNNNIKIFINDENKSSINRKYTFEKLKTKKNLTINAFDKETNNIKRTNSENNIKIKRNKNMIELHTSKINKFIKKSKSSKLIYMNRIKNKPDYDTIIKYNTRSASAKMKRIEILKINEQINNLCDKEINFYSFCEILFNFGFVNIKHQEEYIKKYSEIDTNDEIIDNLLIHAYFNENLITKDFIFNEINIIKKAFKSIHEDFIIQNYETIKLGKDHNSETILSDINYTISIQKFKLFVFIISNLFEGIDFNIIKIKDGEKTIKDIEKYKEDKIDDNFNKDYEIKDDRTYIYNLIRKIIHVKNMNKYTTDFINIYKSHFNYMIINYEKFKYLSEVQNKEKKTKPEENLRNHYEYSFKPKVNKSKSLNYFKEKLDKTKKSQENNFYKNQSLRNYKLSKEQLFTFKPKIENSDLKKIFEKPHTKNYTSLRNETKKFDNILHSIKVNTKAIKEINNEDTKVNNIISPKQKNNKKDNIDFQVTFNPKKSKEEKKENNNTKTKSKTKKKIDNKSQFDKINSDIVKKNNIKSVIMLNIKNANKNSILVIDPKDDYKETINKFCLENELQSEQYMKILQAVRHKINQNNI